MGRYLALICYSGRMPQKTSTATPGVGILSEAQSEKRAEIVELLTRAYWMEAETVLSYLANAANLDGIRAEEIAEALDADVEEELGHARKFAGRIKDLYGTPPGTFDMVHEQGSLQPGDPTDVVERHPRRHRGRGRRDRALQPHHRGLRRRRLGDAGHGDRDPPRRGEPPAHLRALPQGVRLLAGPSPHPPRPRPAKAARADVHVRAWISVTPAGRRARAEGSRAEPGGEDPDPLGRAADHGRAAPILPRLRPLRHGDRQERVLARRARRPPGILRQRARDVRPLRRVPQGPVGVDAAPHREHPDRDRGRHRAYRELLLPRREGEGDARARRRRRSLHPAPGAARRRVADRRGGPRRGLQPRSRRRRSR